MMMMKVHYKELEKIITELLVMKSDYSQQSNIDNNWNKQTEHCSELHSNT